MELIKNNVKNFFAAITNFFKLFSGVILFFAYARFFSISEFWDLTYAIAIGIIAGLIVEFGYIIYLPKEAARDSSSISNLVSKSLDSKILLSAVCLTLIILGHRLEVIVGDLTALVAFCCSTIFLSLGNTFLLPYRSL